MTEGCNGTWNKNSTMNITINWFSQNSQDANIAKEIFSSQPYVCKKWVFFKRILKIVPIQQI